MCDNVPVKPGLYTARIIYIDEKEFGTRVASISVIHTEYANEPASSWTELDFEVGVDSGQAGIFDNSAYPEDADSEGIEVFYNECCELTLSHEQGGVLFNDDGIVSSSGFGDGGYAAYALKHGGKTVGLMIDFGLAKGRKIMEMLMGCAR